jgi:hypothetical protein
MLILPVRSRELAKPRGTMKASILLPIFLLASLSSYASSVSFNTVALQDNGFVSIPLGTGLDPLLVTGVGNGHQSLSFITYMGPIGAVVFSSTLSLPGSQLSFGPFDLTCQNQCGVIFGFQVPPSYHATAGSLAVTINGVTNTYNFQYQTAVPEPATLTLTGIGLFSILSRRNRSPRSRTGPSRSV